MKKRTAYLFIFMLYSSLGCNHRLQCERHYLPEGFIGSVKIYFNQKNGQKKIDDQGCAIYQISSTGKCYSALPYNEGIALPDSTFKYFEYGKNHKLEPIEEFEPNQFYNDSLSNMKRKFVYFISSGYEAPNYVFTYYVDFGFNHKKYNNM